MARDTQNQMPTDHNEAKTRQITARMVWIEVCLMTLVGITVPAIVYLDMLVIFEMMSERSLTEGSQLVLLALTATLFAFGAARLPQARGYLVAMATLVTVMCIRESDGLLDKISQGFWVYPALLVALGGGLMIWLNRRTISAGFMQHYASRYGMLVLMGFFVLIVFSRSFGSGDLWRAIMAENYTPQIKGAIQEGLELLGYAIVAIGTVGSYLNDFGQSPASKT